MSAHSVSPPALGTTSAVSIDALAARGMYELSVCQPSLPRTMCMISPSGGRISPSGVTLLMRARSRPGSNGPKRSAKARCSSSDRCWPGKISSAWAWKASSTTAQRSSSRSARRSPVTRAPSVAGSGSMVISVVTPTSSPPGPGRRGAPAVGREP